LLVDFIGPKKPGIFVFAASVPSQTSQIVAAFSRIQSDLSALLSASFGYHANIFELSI